MNKGIWYGVGAYLMWGLLPLYLKQLDQVPALQILGHRIIWSFGLLVVIVSLRKDWSWLRATLASMRTMLMYVAAAALLSINWLVYIYGVNNGFIVETSLGYFINPLVNILLGVLVFRERMRPLQWAAISLAALGVGYMTVSYGRLPWIGLTLATSFATYGLVKKIAPLNSLHGLTLETGILTLPALLLLGWTEAQGSGVVRDATPYLMVLLLLSGVITSVPLLLFGAAVRSIPLTLLGLLQYIAPTCQFLIGVLIYGEAFDQVRMVGFSLIWIALALLWIEGMNERRQRLRLNVSTQ